MWEIWRLWRRYCDWATHAHFVATAILYWEETRISFPEIVNFLYLNNPQTRIYSVANKSWYGILRKKMRLMSIQIERPKYGEDGWLPFIKSRWFQCFDIFFRELIACKVSTYPLIHNQQKVTWIAFKWWDHRAISPHMISQMRRKKCHLCSPNKVGPKIWWFPVSYSVVTFRRILIDTLCCYNYSTSSPSSLDRLGGSVEADERSSIRLARERLRLDTATAQRRQMAEAELRGMLQQGKVPGDGRWEEVLGNFSLDRGRGGRKWMGLFC